MRKREDLIAAPEALNTSVFGFNGGPGTSSPAFAIGQCAYFTVCVDNGTNGNPLWWIAFGSDASMPPINPLSLKARSACFGPYQSPADFYPVEGQSFFRVSTGSNGAHYVRVYRSSLP